MAGGWWQEADRARTIEQGLDEASCIFLLLSDTRSRVTLSSGTWPNKIVPWNKLKQSLTFWFLLSRHALHERVQTKSADLQHPALTDETVSWCQVAMVIQWTTVKKLHSLKQGTQLPKQRPYGGTVERCADRTFTRSLISDCLNGHSSNFLWRSSMSTSYRLPLLA